MADRGRARKVSEEEWARLFAAIGENRHHVKNTAIMKISQQLGLKSRDIVALTIGDVATLDSNTKTEKRSFRINDTIYISAKPSSTSDSKGRSVKKYTRKSVTFSVQEFEKIVKNIAVLAKAGKEINPIEFYPLKKPKSSVARRLPLLEKSLVSAIKNHLEIRLSKYPNLNSSDYLFITQKGGAYSHNTLQEHIAMMLREWAGIAGTTASSGRKSLINKIFEERNVKTAQKIAGLASPASIARTYTDKGE